MPLSSLSLSISTMNKVSASSESILLLHQRYLEKVADQLHVLTTDRQINCLLNTSNLRQ